MEKQDSLYIKTDTELAEYMGMVRQEFYNFKKRDGEAFPTKTKRGWDVNEVVEYFKATGRLEQKPEGVAVDYYVERAGKMKADKERQELEVQRLKDELILSADVYKSWSEQVNNIDRIMKKQNAALSRKLEGLDTPAIKQKLDDSWYEARKAMAK
jgi:hypothetical protein